MKADKAEGMIHMKILQLKVQCFHLEKMKEFYHGILEMKLLMERENAFAVQAGSTKLIFEKNINLPFYHICFRTNDEHFDYMFEKLGHVSALLANEKGEYRMNWEGQQAYFTDPDGNIIEMLVRSPLHNGEKGRWQDVGEVGMPVSSVEDMQAELKPYIYDQFMKESETFAFFGDREGVLVIVKEGRPWYPTDRHAVISSFKMVVEGKENGTFKHPDFPYEIETRKKWEGSMKAMQFRMARPTNQLNKLQHFYIDGLGLKKLGDFNHGGYEGLMIGLPDKTYHLEFIQTEEKMELPEPTKEHLLVFYMPDHHEWRTAIARLNDMGFTEVLPENPYWGRGGITIEDPDGWRVVLMNTPGI
ncbi:VOC family protein [Cytobacillus gottheilii]